MKRFILLCFVLSAFLWNCYDRVFTIGVLCPVSSFEFVPGTVVYRAVRLSLENEFGWKYRNYRLRLLLYDDGYTDFGTVAGYRYLVAHGADVVVGVGSSRQAVYLLSHQKLSVPVVSGSVATTLLTGKDDNFFRVIPDNAVAALHLHRYVESMFPEKESIGILFSVLNEEATRDLAEKFETLEAGGGVKVWRKGVNPFQIEDVRGAVIDVLQREPDVVVVILDSKAAGQVVSLLRANNYTGPVVLVYAQVDEVLAYGGAHSLPFHVFSMVQPLDVETNSKLREVFRLYATHYPPVEEAVENQFFLIYYDLTSYVVRTLRDCTPGHVSRCLRTPRRYKGYFYSFRTDSNGDAEGDYHMVRVDSEGVEPVEMSSR